MSDIVDSAGLTFYTVIPAFILFLVVFFDYGIRCGRLSIGIPFLMCLLMVFISGYFIRTRNMDISGRPDIELGNATAVWIFLFVSYRLCTRKLASARFRKCRMCGRKLSLFNRAFDMQGLCALCTSEVRKASTPRKLKFNCPKCGKRLKGATSEMVGEIGVCSHCKTEFEIESPSEQNNREGS